MIAQLRQICPCKISLRWTCSPTSTECVPVPGMVPGALKWCAMSSFSHTQLHYERHIFSTKSPENQRKNMTVGEIVAHA
jgi:hypothetical protein